MSREKVRNVEMRYIEESMERRNLTKRQYYVLNKGETEEWEVQVEKNM